MPFHSIESESTKVCEQDVEQWDLPTTFRMIEDALDEVGAETPTRTEETVALPLQVALSLMPAGTVADEAHIRMPDEPVIEIEIPNLYTQLASGRVTMKMAKLAYAIPSHLLNHAAYDAAENEDVMLPLKDVVSAVGFGALRRHCAENVRHYENIDRLDDPFSARPSVDAPSAESMGIEPDDVEPSVDPPACVVSPELPVSVAHEASQTQTEAPVDSDFSDDFHEVLGNVNVNTADLSELMTLEGVSEALARRIIQNRDRYGLFEDVFDLRRVPRIGRKTFRRMTGMPYSRKRHHRGLHLARLLRIPAEYVSDLNAIAEALAGRPGFSGCVISDGDGLLVAQSSAGVLGDKLSAVAPRIVRQIRENMNAIGAGLIDSISICIDGRMLTLVSNRNVALTAIHEESRVTKSQLALIRKVGRELAWLLSHRAYVA
jgi:competence ComEA-like helix-hairpin-helix protein